MPNDVHFGGIGGVAVNSQGHVFVFHRGNVTGAAYMAQAAQLLEFDKDGKFLREIGKNNFALAYARGPASTNGTTSGLSTRART